MATLGSNFFDLVDLYARSDETRKIAVIIELLAKTNAILEDAIAMECNQGTKHLTTVRTGLPAVTWGQLYQGIAQSKSTTAQVHDTTGFVEGLSSIDKRLLDIAKDRNAVRLSEAQGYLEALSQEVASTIIYGNVATDPTKFTGFAPRFNSTTAGNGGQIVKAGGSGSDNTSIWFVTWGDLDSHLLYPEGTQAGVMREDKGEQRVLDASSNPYYVEEELFRQHIGLTVRDWRTVSRVCNIDVSDLQAGTVDIYKFMRNAFWKVKRHANRDSKMVIYCNADVLEALDAGATPTSSSQPTSATVYLRRDEVEGKEVMSYRGIPVRQVDAILNNEAAIA
ncbi:MAG TPA: hypothetical protein VFA34_11690 [Actinomycetota bacterium]|jgi:hypothetical protein|nr:hypothetical protein [Actinomycetota bacterium]